MTNWNEKYWQCYHLLKRLHDAVSQGLYQFNLNEDVGQTLRDIQKGKKTLEEVDNFISELERGCHYWETLNQSKHV